MRSALIDTNLLILLIVGRADKAFISKHKRLSQFDDRDYELLLLILSDFGRHLTTPNVLTEASNLLAQIPEPARSDISRIFKDYIDEVLEQHVPSTQAAGRAEFPRIGLTDCALIESTDDDVVLLTSDLGAYLAASQAGRHAINFTHERARAGLLTP